MSDGDIPKIVDGQSARMLALLQDLIRMPSTSGQEGPLTRWVADWAASAGFETDLWQADDDEMRRLGRRTDEHLPLAGRPTLVIRLAGRGARRGRSLMFNAHADVVLAPRPERWRLGPWSGAHDAGRVHGRGASDAKGPLVSALWAMTALRILQASSATGDEVPRGDLLLELVPGEEDCVGLGTFTSIARGYSADAAVVLEPTGGRPCRASRAGCRFEVVCTGRAVHGTVKWEGVDAITLARHALDALALLERRWDDRSADTPFAEYPILRPVTPDSVCGGEGQGMICDRCVIRGYLELLPGDDLASWKRRFEDELAAELAAGDLDPSRVAVRFTEEYPGHETPASHALCRTALAAARSLPARRGAPGLGAFNSGCEAGERARSGVPTLVWGPGSLSDAHAVDESVEFREVRDVAVAFAMFAASWLAGQDPSLSGCP